ncbi:MAG: peptide deformylase [Candidatus Shikimatogenerans bostrichidophilus]|nr:MAG: peptide deformylase [Candidatus Shikimatogenerans bostrichidophilus]
MILPIILYNNNNKILRKKSKNINIKKKKKIINIINNMFDTMYFNNGIGLSAPQIGININLFILGINNIKMTFINSKIINYSNKKILSKEGCLSLPDRYVNIYRKKNIYIEYYNSNFIKKKIKLYNIYSIIFQHEFDHINGKLIIDYL